MQETFSLHVEAAGEFIPRSKCPDAPRPYGIADGGVIIHELGTARDGSEFRRLGVEQILPGGHDVRICSLPMAAPFVTNADKNPTLTIMALSWRTSDYLLDQAKKGNL